MYRTMSLFLLLSLAGSVFGAAAEPDLDLKNPKHWLKSQNDPFKVCRCLEKFSPDDVAGLNSTFTDQTQKTTFVKSVIDAVSFARFCSQSGGSGRDGYEFNGHKIQCKIEEFTNRLHFDAWDIKGLPRFLWLKEFRFLLSAALNKLADTGTPERCFSILQELADIAYYSLFDDPIVAIIHNAPEKVRSVCARGIQELARSHNVDRLTSIALILGRALSEHVLVGDCLLASPDTSIYFAGNKHRQILIETYIAQVLAHEGLNTEDVKRIEAVWMRMSPEESGKSLEALDRSVDFKKAVWSVIRRNLTSLFLTEHPHLASLFRPIHETEERIRRWLSELGFDEGLMQEHHIQSIYRHIYYRIRTSAYNREERDKLKTLLFAVYRVMQCSNELESYNKDECLDEAMSTFHALGIRLHEKLYPENPHDNRTLFSTYLTGLENHYDPGPICDPPHPFSNLQNICNLLTPDELSAEVIALQHAEDFAPWFERRKRDLHIATRWCPFAATLLQAGEHVVQQAQTSPSSS